MSRIWLQLKTAKQVQVNGNTRNCKPGDWVEIANKQMARLWIAQGEAEAADPALFGSFDGVGFLLRYGAHVPPGPFGENIPVTEGTWPDLPYDITVMVSKGTPLKPFLIPAAIGILDNWHVATPVASYAGLAFDIGTPEAQARTKAVTHDLRVPYFNTGLVIIRREEITRKLIETWVADMQETGDDERLCYLRALYAVKPYHWPLPVSWGEK